VRLFLAEIWRYPVKSMAGEALQKGVVGPSGIAGDRLVQVYNERDLVVTARSHPALLGHRGTLGPSGEPLVDGRPWSDSTVLEDVRRIVGPHARLERDEHDELRFDVLPLLVATDGAIAAFGRDGRRLRPNLVIGGVTGLDERRWPGGRLHIGDVVIDIHSLRGRCVMTTFDPDSLEQDPGVLRDIVKRFGGKLALNCAVVRGGTIHVGQPVEFIGIEDKEFAQAAIKTEADSR
jgi:MOSC domain-containing protein